MILSVHQPQYIPWLGYFDKIARSDCFVFLDQVQYKPREFQNRNKIRTKDGCMWLTVPVKTKSLGRQKICDVTTDNSYDWQRQHLKSIKIWYGSAHFFENYLSFFDNIYAEKWEKLIALNIHITDFILKELEIHTPVYVESDIGTDSVATDRIVELCKKLKADVYLSGIGGKKYLEEEKFLQAGIALQYQDFLHPVYTQLYTQGKDTFLPHMSAIDLLFNEGPGSKNILRGESEQTLKRKNT
jgi:hypothetical protein